MSEVDTKEQVVRLRSAIAAMRFPMLIVASVSGLMMLLYGVGLAIAIFSMLATLRGPFSSPIRVFAMMVFAYATMLMPVTLMLRAAIQGFRSRSDPKRVLDMARLYERYWMWTAGLTAVFCGIFMLFFFFAAMR